MITVQLPSNRIYWQNADDTMVDRILTNLESMIRNEFADAPFELRIVRMDLPTGSGVHGEDLDACQAVYDFIAENWQAAL